MDFQITNSSQVLDFCLKRLARYAENNCLDVSDTYLYFDHDDKFFIELKPTEVPGKMQLYVESFDNASEIKKSKYPYAETYVLDFNDLTKDMN